MAEEGADAVIVISNHFCRSGEGDEIWLENCEKVLSQLDPAIDMGIYECPHPYKRLLSPQVLKYLADTGRFYFMKDTCCDADEIRRRLDILKGTSFGLYNANSATLLETLQAGAAGFSGVMANMHPEPVRVADGASLPRKRPHGAIGPFRGRADRTTGLSRLRQVSPRRH